MEQRPEQPPEGKLIAAATDRLSLSIREAARRAGISYGRWRQITSGFQNVSPGSYAAVHAPARTLARMAAVVGVTADEMETEGQRPDVAEVMRETEAREPIPLPPALDAGPRATALPEIVIRTASQWAPLLTDLLISDPCCEHLDPGWEQDVWESVTLSVNDRRSMIAYGRWRRAEAKAGRTEARLTRT